MIFKNIPNGTCFLFLLHFFAGSSVCYCSNQIKQRALPARVVILLHYLFAVLYKSCRHVVIFLNFGWKKVLGSVKDV